MSVKQMPIRNDIPAYTFQTELDGDLYTFDFHFSRRSERWFFDIYDAELNLLVAGVKCLCRTPVLGRYKDDRLPPGNFIFVNQRNASEQPNRENFSITVFMLYEEAA